METIATKNAPAAIGPYSQGKVTGGLVFTSGQIPIDPATGDIVGTDIATQAEQSCKNVDLDILAFDLGIDRVTFIDKMTEKKGNYSFYLRTIELLENWEV